MPVHQAHNSTSMTAIHCHCYPWPHFYQTRSAWSMDQGSNENQSPVNNFAPTVTKFCVMWEGQALPHDPKFGNCRDKIVDSRLFLSWSLIHGSSWSGLIKVGPGAYWIKGRSCILWCWYMFLFFIFLHVMMISVSNHISLANEALNCLAILGCKCSSKMGDNWFELWPIAYYVALYYLNQWWFAISMTPFSHTKPSILENTLKSFHMQCHIDMSQNWISIQERQSAQWFLRNFKFENQFFSEMKMSI